MSSSQELTGGCLCGAAQYELNASFKEFYFCHCSQCRKLTGSSFASNILCEPTKITWTKGVHKVKRFDYPGEGAYTQVFCTECGSGLPFLSESGTTLFIPAGSVDTELDTSVTRSIFWGDRSSWIDAGLDAKKCTGFPD